MPKDADNRSKKRRTNQPMDPELYAILKTAHENADTDFVLEFRGKPVRNSYAGMKALYRRAGVDNLHVHDLRRTAATYVNRELDGDISAAAGFIGDTEQVAAKHYVQDAAETRLPQVQALARVMARARGASPSPQAAPSNMSPAASRPEANPEALALAA